MSVLRWDNEAGQAVIAAAANLWSGGSIPDWRDNEYARGQVETIVDSVQLYTDKAVARGIDGEQLKDRAWSLMSQAQPPQNLPTMTETEFKERWAGFDGDALSQGRFNVTVEGWEDVTETPSECIGRLNKEVVEGSRRWRWEQEVLRERLGRMTAERDAARGGERRYCSDDLGDLKSVDDETSEDVWWVVLEMPGDTQGKSTLMLSDQEAIQLGQNMMTTALAGRVARQPKKEDS
jgi:hypothetical protein